MKEEIIAALQIHDFKKAAQLAASKYPQYPAAHTEQTIQVLHIIQEFKPAILASIEDPEQIAALRFAAMMQALGFRAKRDMPMPFETGLPFDNMTAARMFVFFSSQQINLHNYQQLLGEKARVKIIGVADDRCCPACQKIKDLMTTIEDAPELPYPFCTSEIGCRCNYGLVSP